MKIILTFRMKTTFVLKLAVDEPKETVIILICESTTSCYISK